MKSILIIEDDTYIAELERDYLEANGYDVEIETDGIQGEKTALKEDYDLIILDIMLPGINGFEICRHIRQEKNVPIIIVTARQDDVDLIRGLGLGADDYIMKPFNPSELIARVKAHIEIHERLKKVSKDRTEEIIEHGELKIMVPEHKVLVKGQEVELRNKEFELLVFLASNPGIVYSKETLFERVWGWDSTGDAATIAVHINRIREKIEPMPSEPQ
ncbi:MAG: response regulator transcription factor, partial [Dehalococcoidales bacterium]|nr:response regulator transcription factor [Dehalococcoidales bacterium]